jgi:metal-responsive CopG/Arc/MetJ family transcriptional regulator
MPGIRKRGEEIRDFIVSNITENRNIAALTAERFGISLSAVYKHIDRLMSEKQVIKKGGRFVLQSKQYRYVYRNDRIIGEDTVWEEDIKKHFIHVPLNVRNIWIYGFLEIFNNAIEHSKGKRIHVVINENRIFTTMSIADDGIGIFKNIKTKFRLADEKDALLELVKGKRTTNNTRHSGQGIFFTSKVFDDFLIISNGITFDPNQQKNNKPKTERQKYSTYVYMRITKNSNKKIKDIFDKFSTEIPGSFDKTIVPVYMANSSDLVSRSQARRILSGLELFSEVILDFRDIEYIGQAFADEIFRVFKNMYPNIMITAQNANTEVQYMINRTTNTKLG